MSKITFRADDDLIARLEEFDASKSEVMREALREYLDGADTAANTGVDDTGSLDELVAERVDAIITDRLETAFTPQQPQDINVNISLDGDAQTAADAAGEASHAADADVSHAPAERKTDPDIDGADVSDTCSQCGEDLTPSHVYCPNCGEKASHRVFCECGDELRSDWGFCPSCGRRTPAADVLDQG